MSQMKHEHVSTKYWECGETCHFKNGKYIWGVVIQRITCEDHSEKSKYCFKFLRFMDARDSSEYIHSKQHEIFWAVHLPDYGWKLVDKIKFENGEIVNSKKAGVFDNPPAPLPLNQTFFLPVKYRMLDF